MGIPLAALSLRPPPQQPSPIEQYGQAVQLKSLLAAQQMLPLEMQQRQQQVQLGQVQLQRQQLQFQQEQALQKAYSESGGDLQNFQDLSRKYGAGLLGMQAVNQMRMQVSSMDEATFKAHEAANDIVGGHIQSIQDAKDPIGAYQQVRQQILSDPALTRYVGGNLPQDPVQALGPDWIKKITSQFKTADQLIKERTAAGAEERGQAAMIQALGGPTLTAQDAQVLQQAGIPAQAGMSLKTVGVLGATFNQQANRDLRVMSFQALEVQRRIANEMAEARLAESKERGEEAKTKAEMTWVQGQDPKTGKYVAVPLSQARDLNLQNKALLDNTDLQKVLSAREAVDLVEKKGPENAPAQQGILQLADSLAKDGKLGVAISRWNSFLTGGIGISPGDDPKIISLLDKSQLFATRAMQAHFGASGGRSPQMLQHFLDLANVKKMDATTFRGGVGAVNDYMRQISKMPAAQATQPGAGPPSGTIQVSDGHGGIHTFPDQKSADTFKKLAGLK